MQLEQLTIYPLKSGAGIPYQQAYASLQGFLHDREWLVCDSVGNFVTARTHPQMIKIQLELYPGAACFHYAGKPSIMAIMAHYQDSKPCQVWQDRFDASYGDPAVDRWFSDILRLECKLLWLGNPSARQQKNNANPLSFADGYPYLLINQASLDALNSELEVPVTAEHFRANLLISGALPFEEDDWTRIRIGNLEFSVDKPCSRCILTTVDPETGLVRTDREPLTTLSRLHTLEEGVCFGMNLTVMDEGMLQTGANVDILASKYAF